MYKRLEMNIVYKRLKMNVVYKRLEMNVVYKGLKMSVVYKRLKMSVVYKGLKMNIVFNEGFKIQDCHHQPQKRGGYSPVVVVGGATRHAGLVRGSDHDGLLPRGERVLLRLLLLVPTLLLLLLLTNSRRTPQAPSLHGRLVKPENIHE